MPFARAMYRSLHEVVLPHEDYVGVYPTHGAGSLCSTGHLVDTVLDRSATSDATTRCSAPTDVDAFATILLTGQPAFPRYFARMRPTNQAGPRLLGGRVPDARPLASTRFGRRSRTAPRSIDLRSPVGPRDEPHPGLAVDPGGLVLRDVARLGRRPRPARRPRSRATRRLGRRDPPGAPDRPGAGRGPPPGRVRKLERERRRPLEAGGRLTVDQLAAQVGRGGSAAPLVIDVRQSSEYESRPCSRVAPPRRRDRCPIDSTSCPATGRSPPSARSGYRASVAASLLRAAGFRDVSWVADGVPAWRRRGHEVEHGAPPDAAVTTTGASVDADGHGHPHATPAQPPADEPAAARRR